MTTPVQVGRRLRRFRLGLGLSQSEVATPLMTPSYLSLIESGQRMPSAKILEHLAERLQVDVEEILTGRSPGMEAELEVDLQNARASLREGQLDEAEEIASRVLRQAEKDRFERIRAKGLTLLGLIEEEKGSLEVALSMYEQAIEAWGDNPLHLRYEAVSGIGRCHYFSGRARLAAHRLELYLLDLGRGRVQDPTAEGRIQSTLIHVYRSMGLRDKELEAARRADELSLRITEPDQLACLKLNVASALIEHGEYQDAAEAAREAERIYASLGWPVSVSRSQRERAIGEIARGNPKEARDLLVQALSTLDTMGRQSSEHGYVLNELGRTERLVGSFSEALEHLAEARRLLPEKDIAELALNAREVGLCLADIDPKKAERELRRALSLYQEADSPNEAATTLLHLGRLQQAQGKTKVAIKTLEQAVEAAVGEVR